MISAKYAKYKGLNTLAAFVLTETTLKVASNIPDALLRSSLVQAFCKKYPNSAEAHNIQEIIDKDIRYNDVIYNNLGYKIFGRMLLDSYVVKPVLAKALGLEFSNYSFGFTNLLNTSQGSTVAAPANVTSNPLMDFATFILSQTIGIASHALIGKSTYNAVRFVGDNTFKLFGIKDTMTSADGYFYSYDAFARSTALMISHDAPIVAFSYFALGTTIDPRVIALKYAITLLWSYAAADETDLGRQAKLDSIIIKEMAGVIPIDKVLEGAKNFAEKPLETLSFGAKQIGTSAVNTIISLIQNIYIMSILGGTTALCSTTIDSLNESDKNSFYKKYIAKHSIIKNLFEGTLKSSFVYGTHIILRESVAWYTGKAIADPDLLARFAGTAMFYTLMPKETFNFIDRSSFDVAGALPDIMSIFSEMA